MKRHLPFWLPIVWLLLVASWEVAVRPYVAEWFFLAVSEIPYLAVPVWLMIPNFLGSAASSMGLAVLAPKSFLVWLAYLLIIAISLLYFQYYEISYIFPHIHSILVVALPILGVPAGIAVGRFIGLRIRRKLPVGANED